VQDKYEYIKQIGHGAYGVVCSALDHKLKAKVAIKKVPKAFEDLIDAKRIVREIKLLSKYTLSITDPANRILRPREHYWPR
jgi:mitogen-activated protein kinase 1/3